MDIELRYDNIMYVDGEVLEASQVEELKTALTIGRVAIIDAIDSVYDKQLRIYQEDQVKNPNRLGMHNPQRGSVVVSRLGKKARLARSSWPQGVQSASVVREKRNLYRRFHPHWEVAESADFIPEVNELGILGGGFFLAVRDEPWKTPEELQQEG